MAALRAPECAPESGFVHRSPFVQGSLFVFDEKVLFPCAALELTPHPDRHFASA